MSELKDKVSTTLNNISKRLIGERNKTEKDKSENLSGGEILESIKKLDNSAPLLVYTPNKSVKILRPDEVNETFLESLDNYTIFCLKTKEKQGSSFIVKRDGVYKTNFVESWVSDSDNAAKLEKEREKRWEILENLGWPVVVWHGTSRDKQKSILSTQKHYLLSSVTFTDSIGYAAENGDAVLAYAFPAQQMDVIKSLTARKFSLKNPKQLNFIKEGDFQKEKRLWIDLGGNTTYDYSLELEDYLKAVNINYEIINQKDIGKQIIKIPVLQRNYKKSKENLREYNGDSDKMVFGKNHIKSWDNDLFGDQLVKFKDGVIIRLIPEKIPVS